MKVIFRALTGLFGMKIELLGVVFSSGIMGRPVMDFVIPVVVLIEFGKYFLFFGLRIAS